MKCSAVKCSAVKCSEVQCSEVQWSAVQWSAVQWSAVKCSAVKCSEVQCSAVQCSEVQSSEVQCSEVQFTWRERCPDSNRGAAECNRAQCCNMATLWRTKLAAGSLLGCRTLLSDMRNRAKLLALRYGTLELRVPLGEGKQFDTLNTCMEKQGETGALYRVKYVW